MEHFCAVLSGIVMPVLLLSAGIFFGVRLRFFWIKHPLRTLRTMSAGAEKGGTHPLSALTVALAGTLGVGNIAGVATAITAGGAGAVFWMLAGAFCAMSVKYAEVSLAVRFRRTRREGGRSVHFGGAMYYIRDGLTAAAKGRSGRRAAVLLGGLFALLCALNALLTGNTVQVHAAVSCTELPPLLFGVLFAAAAVIAMAGGMRRLSRLTSVLIPVLAGGYLLLCAVILLVKAAELPEILARICREAFNFTAVGGGVLGYGVSRAIRFGITRGIFSNEAGCGTAPTAHAAADTKSPHHQGCLGLFEVFADTVILCTATALVLLLYTDGEGLDGIRLSLAAFSGLCGEIGGPWLAAAAEQFLKISILLFAFATVVCQSCYGIEAIRYFVPGKGARVLFIVLSAGAVMTGAVIPAGILWQWADLTVSVMTAVNVLCLLRLSRFVANKK